MKGERKCKQHNAFPLAPASLLPSARSRPALANPALDSRPRPPFAFQNICGPKFCFPERSGLNFWLASNSCSTRERPWNAGRHTCQEENVTGLCCESAASVLHKACNLIVSLDVGGYRRRLPPSCALVAGLWWGGERVLGISPFPIHSHAPAPGRTPRCTLCTHPDTQSALHTLPSQSLPSALPCNGNRAALQAAPAHHRGHGGCGSPQHPRPAGPV